MPTIAEPAFAGDDGSADPAVQAALAAYDAHPEAGLLPALSLLQDARVLVPVVAVPGEGGTDATGGEKDSSMATVLITGRDGRQALLAFTGQAALQRWRADARPVPVPMRQAAAAARDEGAAAVVVDVAGPVVLPVEEEHLGPLAAGLVLVRLGDGAWGWAEPADVQSPSPRRTLGD